MSQGLPSLKSLLKPVSGKSKAPTTTYKVYLPLVMNPITDMNYYLVSTDNMYALGKKRGQQYQRQHGAHNGVVILDFGMPYY